MYDFILLPKYIYLIENMYLYIHTCIYYTCDMIPPPPKSQHIFYMWYIWRLQLSFLWIFGIFFWHILWQNYTSKFMYTRHLSQRFHCSNLFTRSQKLIVFNFEKKTQIFISTVYILTYFSFCMVQNQNFKSMKNRKL